MNVSRINQRNIELDRTERANIQYKREEDYRKVIEKKNIERIIAERVERNILPHLKIGYVIQGDTMIESMAQVGL